MKCEQHDSQGAPRTPRVLASQNGFSLISFVALLPFFTAVVALFAAVIMTLNTDAKARQACRTELLKSQEIVTARLTALMELNPQAESLRIEKKSLEQACNMSADPVPCMELAFVIVQQAALAVKQKALIASATLESRLGPVKAETAVFRSLQADQTNYMETGEPSYSNVASHSFHTASFDVVASPSDSLTPDYKPSANFERNQTMRVEWNIGLIHLLPKWPQKFIPDMNIHLKAECAATIAKGEGFWKNKWAPLLANADKR